MLTGIQYEDLWVNPAPAGFGMPLHLIPNYYQYLQREVYFQDYLDLFCCPKNQRPTFERKLIGKNQTVLINIEGFTLLPDPFGKLTVEDSNGEIKLIVDNDFPFYGALCKERSIKYILIGEAAPNTGNYIYKDAKGSYITAPLSAKGINTNPLKKTDRLIHFANEGFLLLDLFPFAIDFRATSITLNNAILRILIDQLIFKINGLVCLDPEWDFCLVAPKRTSNAILNWLDTFNHNNFNGKSTIHPLDLLGSAHFLDGKKNTHKDHTLNLWGKIWKISHLSKRVKFTVIVGGSGPNKELIRRVFYLP